MLLKSPRLLEFVPDYRIRNRLISREDIWETSQIAGSLYIVLTSERVHTTTLNTHVP